MKRLRRWALRFLAFVAVLIALVAVAVLVLVHSLDREWLKRRLQAQVRAATGVDIDYRSVRIGPLSGAEILGLVVRSPAEVRPFAPDLVRIGRVDARWRVASLLGRGPILQRLAVSDVTLTVVVDDQGRTSFDALPSVGATAAPSAPVPLSRQASSLLGVAPPVGQIDVDDVTLALIRTEKGEVSERLELRGLSVTIATVSAPESAKGWRVKAAFGSPGSPLDLRLARGAGEPGITTAAARARLWLTVDATAFALTAVLDLRVPEQTFAPTASVDHWLHAEAALKFDPSAGRTEVTLDHTEAGDGAANVEGSIEIPDTGDPIVSHARGDVDLARILRWVPPGALPVAAERAQVHYQIDSLVAGPVLRLSDGGKVAVDLDLSNLEVSAAGGPLRVGQGKLSLRAQPAEGGGVAGQGSIQLARTRLASGSGVDPPPRSDRGGVDDLDIEFEGRQAVDGAISGRAGARFGRLSKGGASPVTARDGRATLHVEGLHPGADDPLATRGDLALSIALASLDARLAGTRVIADGLSLRAHTLLAGHAPYAAELGAHASRLRVLGPTGAPLVDAPARIDVGLRDVRYDLVDPPASRGLAHIDVDLHETKASLDLTKGDDALDFALGATASTLKAVRPFLTPALAAEVPWEQIGVTVRSSGRAEGIRGSAATLKQTTEVDVERPAFGRLAARSLSLTLRSKGTALEHEAALDLRLQALAIDGDAASDDHATLSVTLDRARPSLRLQLDTEGRVATTVSASVSFDRPRRALVYGIDGHLAGLAPLAPFAAKMPGLDGFDLSQLDVGISAHGALLGVVAEVLRDGTIELEPSPARTAAALGDADLRLAHLRWAKGDTAITTPALAWHGDLRAVGARRTLDSRFELGTVHLDLGSRDVDLNGIRDVASAVLIGNLTDPEIELTQRLSVSAVEQDVVPEYPLGDLSFALSAARGREGVVHISELKVANGRGGTALALAGNLDLGDGHRTLSITTSLTQDLARLSTIPERFKGRGRLAVEANVTSPDLAHFRVQAAVKGEGVTVTLPRAGVEVDAANGEVPVTVALEVRETGVVLQRSEKRSPYSMLRFADQHPLLSRSGFLSIARLKTPFVSIAPLVGNLEIDQNVVSLRQFELGVRGGTITGQCGIDWEGPKSTLELHVRASGVQSSHGEPFDGNIAVVISAADRTVEGRAEILRIGERHLLDLLDLEDPLHVDPAINRVRTALGFGYPDSLRLAFDHGFASAHLELGGLARLISIGELRGIPMGPIVDKLLAPMLDGLDPDGASTPEAASARARSTP